SCDYVVARRWPRSPGSLTIANASPTSRSYPGSASAGGPDMERPPADPRRALLQRLPRRSVCAEIGVYQGDFSAQILGHVRPRRLHLIDPWRYEADARYENAWYGGRVGTSQAKMDAV